MNLKQVRNVVAVLLTTASLALQLRANPPEAAQVLKTDKLQEPPMQEAAWTPPKTDLHDGVNTAAARMFQQALAGLPCLVADDSPQALTPHGTVIIKVLGPDLQPIANSYIQATIKRSNQSSGQPDDFQTIDTDAEGVARLDYPAGRYRFQIQGPDGSFTYTGLLPIYPKVENVFRLPALIPAVQVTGSIPAEFAGPIGSATFYSNDQQNHPVTVEIDSKGKFSAKLHPGNWWVSITQNDKWRLNIQQIVFEAVPFTSVNLPLSKCAIQGSIEPATNPSTQPGPPPDNRTCILSGNVLDENGKPVSGATVCSVAEVYTGIGTEAVGSDAISDKDGRYRIKVGVTSAWGDTLVMAVEEGFLPATAWYDLPQRTGVQATTKPTEIVRNLRMSSRVAKLDIKVTFEGKPVPNAPVFIQRDDGGDVAVWTSEMMGRLRASHSALLPEASAGADGVAHFNCLQPGRYLVVATDGVHRPQEYWDGYLQPFRPHDAAAFAIAAGVAVRGGEVCKQDLPLRISPGSVSFQIDLRAVSYSDNTLMNAIAVAPFSSYNSSGRLEKTGKVVVGADEVGLYKLDQRWTGRGLPEGNGKPSYAINGYIADSPLLKVKLEQVSTPHWQEAARLSVEVRDQANKPCRAVVSLHLQGVSDQPAGCTDSDGNIEFDGLEPWDYVVNARWEYAVRAQVEKPAFAALVWRQREDGTILLPTDAELTGRTFIPSRTATPKAGALEPHLLMNIKPAGYIHGRLILPAGEKLASYQLRIPDRFLDAKIMIDESSGEFVAGPFESGEAQVWIQGGPNGYAERTSDFTAVGGQVVRADIQVPKPTPELDFDIWPSLAGVSGFDMYQSHIQPTIGTVLMSDRTTPAAGVLIRGYVRGSATPSLGGSTDSTGVIQTFNWMSGGNGDAPVKGTPLHPTLVVLLPGTTGAAVVDLFATRQRPLKIVLPVPIHALGKVTIAGQSVQSLNAKVRVLAAYQGLGSLNELLSVSCTPQADGSFDLAGLTPGTYQVQAVIDNLWLSQSKTITVSENTRPETLSLNIDQPGGPVVVRISDSEGKPVIGAPVKIDRPPGPLTDQCWPAEFLTDGNGAAYIPALEVRKHHIHAQGKTYEVSAPALPCEGLVEVKIMTGKK